MTEYLTAELWSKLPNMFHYKGKPTPWVKMTRPGQKLHSFLEGPCFGDLGNMWLVDVPYGRIFRINKNGKWNLHKTYDGEPHSIKHMGDGKFIISDYKKGLLEYNGTNEFKTLATEFEGQKFKGLSDLTIAPNGDVWFTDSGRTSLSDPTGNVFRYKTDGTLVHVLSNVPYPNGIALSPDGKLVYLAATRANAVWRFLADYPDPQWPMVGNFVQMSGGLGPDGLAVHENGNLAVAHAQAGRVYVYNIFGDTKAVIELPEGLWVTSVIFNGDTLYIIEAQTGSVYHVELKD
ncbi:MAG: SMP-30/gluconolactonase/LRE family protein [Kordiimonadaceae bacterium]|jgi:gluconolactonase|nr:SMP-30/gluconolactonase/LRE family protein [Kordiimonadaceae bacterium]MBT6031161.1 SMP-30/gluconolactonase/LRE family protein [Kordiimonadaceae bacterium]